MAEDRIAVVQPGVASVSSEGQQQTRDHHIDSGDDRDMAFTPPRYGNL